MFVSIKSSGALSDIEASTISVSPTQSQALEAPERRFSERCVSSVKTSLRERYEGRLPKSLSS